MGSTDGDDRAAATLALAARGDEEAWRELVNSFAPRVFALLMRQCADRELADEITQATFVKLVTQLKNFEGYEERGRFEPWLFRIAINSLRDEMRRRQRQARPTDFGQRTGAEGPDNLEAQVHLTDDRAVNPLAQVEHGEQVELMRQAVAQLPEADQQILHLRHTAGMSFPQIAQTLEQPLGTVLARGHRALAKLKKMLGEHDEPESRAV